MSKVLESDLRIRQDALEIRESLVSKLDLFPTRSCKIGAIAMHNRDYEIVCGIVTLDNYCRMGLSKEITHFWNYEVPHSLIYTYHNAKNLRKLRYGPKEILLKK